MILPKSVSLEVSTFQVPAGQYDWVLRNIMALLVPAEGTARSPGDFRANGFVACTGTMAKIGRIGTILTQSGVRSVNNRFLSVFDERPNDVEMVAPTAVISLQYTRKGRKEEATIKPGAMAIRIGVRRPTNGGSACKMTVQPVWKAAAEASFIERSSGVSRDVLFTNSAMDLTMQEGDIVLIGAASADRGAGRLGEMMMVEPNGSEVRLTIIKCTGITQ